MTLLELEKQLYSYIAIAEKEKEHYKLIGNTYGALAELEKISTYYEILELIYKK